MFSIHTNILLHAFNEDSPSHEAAFGWLTAIQHEEDVAISEFILAEGVESARRGQMTR